MVTHSQVDLFTRIADPDVTDPSALREFRMETQPSLKPTMLAFAEKFDPSPAPRDRTPSVAGESAPPPTTFSPYPASPKSAPPPMFSPAPTASPAIPPPAVQHQLPEIDRITANYLAPSPARSARSASGRTFADLVDEVHTQARTMQHHQAPRWTGGPAPGPASTVASSTALAPPNMAMKEYAERRELFIRIEDMKRLGFTFPNIPSNCATEDLKQEIDRREISMNTVERVDTWTNRILKGSQVFHAINSKSKFIPLAPTFHSDIRDIVGTPHFRYNIYKCVLKRSRKSNTSPLSYIFWTLSLPILEGLAIKLFQWLSGWNSPLINGLIRKFIHSGRKKGTKGLPNVSGVTTGVGGGGDTVIPEDGFSADAVAAFSGRTASAVRGKGKRLRPMNTPTAAPAPEEEEAATEVVTAEELSALP